MPAIKLKKAAAEHQAEKEREEREREAEMPSVKPKEQKDIKETKESKEAKDSSLLRGLDSNILFEKRKRQIVPSEQKVIDWIDANLETKENSHVILQHLYDYFAEACSFDGTPVVSMDVFQRRVFDKFGKFFALKESSPYKGVIKERIGKGKGSQQVKADSLKLKMKDIIEEGLKEAGNPAKGIRFNSLKQYIACNYPALRIDLRPGLLKNSLNKGVTYGYIQLVKGIGMAGFYRLPVDEEPDEEEEKAGEDKSKGKAEQNGDSAEGGEKTEEPKKTEEKKKSRKKKEKEEAKKDGEGEDKEGETEEGKEGEGEEEEAKKKKKKKKSRKPRLDSYGAAPKRMEDIFPLAMTYMAEPKQASYQQIKKYIFEYYPNVDENQFRKSLVKGTNKGYWVPLNEKSVFSSRYDLLLDEFDPNSTDNVDDMICSAIIACSEPKIASCNLLKKYIIEYHPEFNIESRPNLFKMALERGAKKGIIVQISGIGATGSFQLCKVYKPSPVVLAGDEEEIQMDIFKGVKEEVYIPRGTKSRKLVPRTEWTETSDRPPQKRKPPTNRNRPSKAKSSRSSSKAKSSSKRGRTAEESDEEEQEEEEQEEEIVEEEEEEDFEPTPKKSKASPKKAKSTPKRGKAKSPAKKGRKPVSRSQLQEDEGEEEEEEEEVPVIEDKRKKSRAEVEEVKSGRGRSKARPNYADDERESGDDEPKKSRGKKSGGSRRGSRVNYGEEDEDEEGETTEYTPRKSKSRGGEVDESPSPKKSKKRR